MLTVTVQEKKKIWIISNHSTKGNQPELPFWLVGHMLKKKVVHKTLYFVVINAVGSSTYCTGQCTNKIYKNMPSCTFHLVSHIYCNYIAFLPSHFPVCSK